MQSRKPNLFLKIFSRITVCICKCWFASVVNVFSLVSHLLDEKCCTSNSIWEYACKVWDQKVALRKMEFAIQKSFYFDIYTSWSNSLCKCSLMNIYYYSLSFACALKADFQANVTGFMRTLQHHGSQCSARSSAGPGRNRRPMAKAITFTKNRLNLKLTSMNFHADTFQQRGVASITFCVSNGKYSLLMSWKMSNRASEFVNMKWRPGQKLHELWKTAYILELITSQQPVNKSDSEMSGAYKSKLLKILQFYEFVYAWKKVNLVHHTSPFHL